MAELVEVDDALSRRQQQASPLYAGRVEVYAKSVQGTFRRYKWAVLVVLLGLYYLAPWIRWDRGPGVPDQAILADMAGRRLYFFWIEIWPQEVYYLTGILMLAAFGLFLATALFGRVWCGFTCPQTVWTDLFMMVERWLEGDRNQRMKFDKAPWTTDKILRRVAKHLVWLLIALATGGAWIMYFNDAPTVLRAFFTGEAGLATYFFVALFTATTYLLAGLAREQVCTYMCPWPRIQGGLLDQDSLVVTYERWRGEPRGKHKKGDAWEGRGDCVDCNQCVAVCPMGIDIRDGIQLECIGCALCIDACNGVMEKLDRPPNLITWDSERNTQLRSAGQPPVYRLIRPRTILYVILLAIVAGIMLVALALRSDTGVNVLPDRNPLFVRLSDGSIRNGYTLKILNKAGEDRSYRVTVEGVPATLSVPGGEAADQVVLTAPRDGVGTNRLFVRLPAQAVEEEQMPVTLVLTDVASGAVTRHETIFRGPEE
ncbi:MAG: cytochrome c oxidase accessory protein CcoG [Geminicoccaceae bacterium]